MVPGVEAMVEVLHETDPWSVVIFSRSPAPEFDDVTPVEVAVAGARGADLVRWAQAVRSEWLTCGKYPCAGVEVRELAVQA